VNWPTAKLALRLRLPAALSAAVGLIAVMAAVGALFPAVGHTIGKLHVPASVSNLLGGGDYGTITGWFRSEIAAIYGPLVIGALAITGASAASATPMINPTHVAAAMVTTTTAIAAALAMTSLDRRMGYASTSARILSSSSPAVAAEAPVIARAPITNGP